MWINLNISEEIISVYFLFLIKLKNDFLNINFLIIGLIIIVVIIIKIK